MAYVYRHIRLDKNVPFYIGLGTDPKYKRALEKTHRSLYWKRVAAKGYEVEIIMDEITKEEAAKKEIEFIALYGRVDKGTGILVNMTDGGDGTYGKVFTPEYRAKLSETAKKRRYSPEVRKTLNRSKIGVKWSEEKKAKYREKLQNKPRRIKTEVQKQCSSTRMSGENNPSLGKTGKLSINFKGFIHAFKNGELVGEYEGVYDCAKQLDVSAVKVSAVLRGRRNHTKGYTFIRINNGEIL